MTAADSVQRPAAASGPPVMSREFIRRAHRRPAPADPDQATAETVALMCQHIDTAALDPLVWQAAQTALAQNSRMVQALAAGPLDPLELAARCVWWYAKHQMKFVHHQKQIEVWFGERHHLQLLISPDVLLRFPFRMEGDCAIFSMLIPGMLKVLGVPWELVTIAVDPREPDVFGHVYVRAILPSGRLALDASHGRYPGWSVPLAHRSRIAVWDESGAYKEDAGEHRYSGLHAYRVRVRGFGQVDTTDTGGDLASLPVDTGAFAPIYTAAPTSFQPGNSVLSDFGALQASAAGNVDTSQGSYSTDPTTGLTTFTPAATAGPAPASSGIVAPSQSSAAWANFATQLAKAGMTLAQINAIQPGTVVSPNGSILRQATGYPVGSTYGGLMFGGMDPTVWIIGGVSLLVLFMMMKR